MGYFLIIFLILVTRPITVLFHELGHAIPALLMTREKVSIYIGSYGDKKNSFCLKIGLFDIWFKCNPLYWRFGLCVPSSKQISISKQIVYVLAGPFTSLVIAAVACYIAFTFDLHGFLKLVFVIFLGSSVFDLFQNLIPRNTPIKLHDRRSAYNDGYRLKELFKYKRFSKEYRKAVGLYNQQKFIESAVLFNHIIESGLKDENIYRLTISSYLQAKNYEQVKQLTEEFMIYENLNSNDYANMGLSYSHLGLYNKAIEFYDKSIELDPSNVYSLNNKGFTLNVLHQYEEAILLFDQVITIDKDFAHSYTNRGLSKIKMRKIKDGLEDINYSLTLDESNSYSYRNLGIYHLDRGEYSEALQFFIRAKELDSTTHMIGDLINEAQKKGIGKTDGNNR